MYGHHVTSLIQWLSLIFIRGEMKKYVWFVKSRRTFFYVRSGADQISVLFRRRPLFDYTVLCKIRKFIQITSMLALKCDVASCATSHYDPPSSNALLLLCTNIRSAFNLIYKICQIYCHVLIYFKIRFDKTSPITGIYLKIQYM